MSQTLAQIKGVGSLIQGWASLLDSLASGELGGNLNLNANYLSVTALGDPVLWQGSNALIGTDSGGPYLQSINGGQLGFDPSSGDLLWLGGVFFVDTIGNAVGNSFSPVTEPNFSWNASGLTFDSGGTYATGYNGSSGTLLMTDGEGDNLTFGGGVMDAGIILCLINTPNGASNQILLTDGDASNLMGTIGAAVIAGFSTNDGKTLHGTDNSTSGITAFQSDGSFAQLSPGAAIANSTTLTVSDQLNTLLAYLRSINFLST